MEKNIVPDWMQEFMLDQLIQEIRAKQYVSASSQARNILLLQGRSVMRPEIIQVAEAAKTNLEKLGYTEQQFIQQMLIYSQNNSCPPESVPKKQDGSCPEGFFPLATVNGANSTLNKKGCCVKIKNDIAEMDKANLEIRGKIQEPDLKQEFENRFLLDKSSPAAINRDQMISVGVPNHSVQFITKFQTDQIKTAESKVEKILKGEAEPVTEFGVSTKLFKAMYTILKTPVDLAKWFVTKDWTYWWIGVYLFRFVSLFACLYVSAANASNTVREYLQQVTLSMFGVNWVKKYLSITVLPTVLCSIILSSMINWFTKGILNSFSAGSYFSTLFSTTFFAQRLMSMLTVPGFAYDASVLVVDLLHGLGQFGMTIYEETTNGNFTGAISAASYNATKTYCQREFKTFLAITFNAMGAFTTEVFLRICDLVPSFKIPLIENGTWCRWFVDMIDKWRTDQMVSVTLDSLVSGAASAASAASSS